MAPAAARLAVEAVEAPLRDSNEIEAVMAQLRRAWRAGHLFQHGRSMAHIIAKAQAAGPARVPAADWAG